MWFPLFDETNNHYKDGISSHANILSHSISEDWMDGSVNDNCTLIIQLKIPILLNIIEISGRRPDDCSINIYKNTDGGRLIKSIYDDDVSVYKKIGIILTPGIYAIEGLNFLPNSNNKTILLGNLNNRFVKFLQGGSGQFNGFGNNYGNTVVGFPSLTFNYRIIDTYLGYQTSQISSSELIPKAWYFLNNTNGFRPVLWDGTSYHGI